MKHSKYCAFLNSSIELLSLGLESTLLTAVQRFNNGLSSEDFCKLILAAILPQSTPILASLSRLLNTHCDIPTTELFCESCDSVYVCNRYNVGGLAERYQCTVTYDDIEGRRLDCIQGTGMGTMLLKESPYVFASIHECGCRENNLLVEHVAMASNILHSAPNNNLQSYQYFLKHFVTGLPTLDESAPHHPDRIHGQQTLSALRIVWFADPSHCYWSFHLQCVMALIGVLLTVYAYYQAHPERKHDVGDLSEEEKVLLVQKAHSLLQILLRLPLNCHAITTLQTSSPTAGPTSTSIGPSPTMMQPKRLGYAAFLTASSVNHSCIPNALLRYAFPPPTIPSIPSVCAVPTAQMIASTVVLELIASQSIHRTEQVTISYGVTTARHAHTLRQTVLHDQYLFVCNCIACKEVVVPVVAAEVQPRGGDDVALLFSQQLTALQDILLQLHTKVSHTLHQLASTTTATQRMQRLTGLQSTLEEEVFHPLSALLLSQHQTHLLTAWNHLLQLYDTYSQQQPKKKSSIVVFLTNQSPLLSSSIAPLIHEYCAVYCLYLDLAAYLAGLSQHYLKACQHLDQMVFLMIAVGKYHEEDVEIARERIKLASLYGNAGDWMVSRQCAQQGYSTLSRLVSKDDPDLLEAQHILQYAPQPQPEKKKKK